MTNTNTSAPQPNPRVISRERLNEMMEKRGTFTLFDVRTKEQFAEHHLPSAISVPLNEQFETAAAIAVPDKARKVVVYCGGESCGASEKASERLVAAGYERVRDFRGGTKDWQDGEAVRKATRIGASPAPAVAGLN